MLEKLFGVYAGIIPQIGLLWGRPGVVRHVPACPAPSILVRLASAMYSCIWLYVGLPAICLMFCIHFGHASRPMSASYPYGTNIIYILNTNRYLYFFKIYVDLIYIFAFFFFLERNFWVFFIK